MREICLSYGAGLCFTEMVSCKGLLYGNENTETLLTLAPQLWQRESKNTS